MTLEHLTDYRILFIYIYFFFLVNYAVKCPYALGFGLSLTPFKYLNCPIGYGDILKYLKSDD